MAALLWTATIAAWAALVFTATGLSTASNTHSHRSTLRLMTYNIHAWRDSDHDDNFDRVVDVVNGCDPDVLCLNEVLHPFKAPGGEAGRAYYEAVKRGEGRGIPLPPDHVPDDPNESYLPRLASATGLPEYTYRAATDVCYFGGVPFGNAILSRYPIRDVAHVPLDVEPGDLTLGEQPRDFVDPRLVTVATILLPPPHRDLGASGVPAGHSLGVCLTHLDHESELLREKQTLRAIDAAFSVLGGGGGGGGSGTPHVFCGDLNSFRRSDTDDGGWRRLCDLYESRGWGRPEERSLVLDALEGAGYADAFYGADMDKAHTVRPSQASSSANGGAGERSSLEAVHPERGDLPGPTGWTKDPVRRIDHVLTSPERDDDKFVVRPRQFSRVITDASDHFPVFVDLDLVPL